MTMIHIPADERWLATGIALIGGSSYQFAAQGREMRVYPAELAVTCCNKPFLRGDGRFFV